jgi:hypothetical protein
MEPEHERQPRDIPTRTAISFHSNHRTKETVVKKRIPRCCTAAYHVCLYFAELRIGTKRLLDITPFIKSKNLARESRSQSIRKRDRFLQGVQVGDRTWG